MHWNRFDICEAWYLFAVNFHPGPKERLNRIWFRPSPSLDMGRLDRDNRQNVSDILANLVWKDRRNGM